MSLRYCYCRCEREKSLYKQLAEETFKYYVTQLLKILDPRDLSYITHYNVFLYPIPKHDVTFYIFPRKTLVYENGCSFARL